MDLFIVSVCRCISAPLSVVTWRCCASIPPPPPRSVTMPRRANRSPQFKNMVGPAHSAGLVGCPRLYFLGGSHAAENPIHVNCHACESFCLIATAIWRWRRLAPHDPQQEKGQKILPVGGEIRPREVFQHADLGLNGCMLPNIRCPLRNLILPTPLPLDSTRLWFSGTMRCANERRLRLFCERKYG